jgi:hypothetical protein
MRLEEGRADARSVHLGDDGRLGMGRGQEGAGCAEGALLLEAGQRKRDRFLQGCLLPFRKLPHLVGFPVRSNKSVRLADVLLSFHSFLRQISRWSNLISSLPNANIINGKPPYLFVEAVPNEFCPKVSPQLSYEKGHGPDVLLTVRRADPFINPYKGLA